MTPEDILQAYIDGKLQDTFGLKNPINTYFPTPELFIEEVEKMWKIQKRAFFKRIQ